MNSSEVKYAKVSPFIPTQISQAGTEKIGGNESLKRLKQLSIQGIQRSSSIRFHISTPRTTAIQDIYLVK